MAIRLLVPLDGSELSEQALPVAKHLSTSFGSGSIELLYALDPRPFVDSGVGGPAAFEALDEELKWAHNYVEDQAKKLTRENCAVNGSVEVGPAPAIILNRVDAGGVDYVVMVTHGRSGLKRALLGSVTERVIRESRVPVVVVHASPPAIANKVPLEQQSEAELVATFSHPSVLARQSLDILVARGSRAVPALLEAMHNESPLVRQHAVRALGMIEDTLTLPALVAAFEDQELEVRWEAAEAVCKFKEAGIVEVLSTILHKASDMRTAASAIHVLERAPFDFHSALKPVILALRGPVRESEAPVAAHTAIERLTSGPSVKTGRAGVSTKERP